MVPRGAARSIIPRYRPISFCARADWWARSVAFSSSRASTRERSVPLFSRSQSRSVA